MMTILAVAWAALNCGFIVGLVYADRMRKA